MEGRSSKKGFPTFITLNRPFTCVMHFVFTEGTFLDKGFAAVRAFIRSLSTVNSLVILELFTSDERFPTFTALYQVSVQYEVSGEYGAKNLQQRISHIHGTCKAFLQSEFSGDVGGH